MTLSRRDFIKLFGIGIASLLVTRCKPVAATSIDPNSPKGRLRQYWMSFDELARRTQEEVEQITIENAFGHQLVTDHRIDLGELVTSGELEAPVADIIQEAFEAAVYHIWRLNVPLTCYRPASIRISYAPDSASMLVQQADILDDFAGQGTIDPITLAKARAALEHDMAFYALSDYDVQTLYVQNWKASPEQDQPLPPFENLPLEVTPDARAAAQFIIDLLTRQ